jgi:predicted MPP superfamily phosphohydrolase
MRQTLLDPPRQVATRRKPEAWAGQLALLAPPARIAPRLRWLFHPERGWVRRLERRASRILSATVYPRIPGITRSYDHVLREQLSLSHAEVVVPRLPSAFVGLRVLLLSDVHAGPFVSPGALAGAFARLLALAPDLIVIAGDLVTCRLGEFQQHRHAFAMLRAPLGVFAVLGNHDHYTEDTRTLCGLIEETGVTLLVNRSVELRREGASLTLAGVDDLLMGEPLLDAALAGTHPPVILLSHNPDLFFEAVRYGVSLMLAGHTHGGQIRIPGWPVLVRQSRYGLDQGRFIAGETELVVSRGLGATGVPWRAACPPEAVLLSLRDEREQLG